MFITPDQEYILSILQKTKVMRGDQAYRLLNKLDGSKNDQYAARCLEQLRYIRKIARKSDGVFTLPILGNVPADEEMLSAMDIMLDLTDFKILELSAGKPPYKLCFLTEQDNSMGSYAVVTVPPGHEASVSASLSFSDPESPTVIFLLSELSQKDGVKTALPHYFTVKDGGKYRYFGGGN